MTPSAWADAQRGAPPQPPHAPDLGGPRHPPRDQDLPCEGGVRPTRGRRHEATSAGGSSSKTRSSRPALPSVVPKWDLSGTGTGGNGRDRSPPLREMRPRRYPPPRPHRRHQRHTFPSHHETTLGPTSNATKEGELRLMCAPRHTCGQFKSDSRPMLVIFPKWACARKSQELLVVRTPWLWPPTSEDNPLKG